jgi:hypothetical protein
MDDGSVRFAAAGARFQEDQGLDILSIGAEIRRQRIEGVGSDPHAILQVTEMVFLQKPPQPNSESILDLWQIKNHESPSTIPTAVPAGFRIASAERGSSAFGGERMNALIQKAGPAY